MDESRKRRRSASLSSLDSLSDADGYEMKRKDRRIHALEELVRQLRRTKNYHSGSTAALSSNDTPSTSRDSREPSAALAATTPIVRYVGRNDIVPEFDPQQSTVAIEHWLRNLESIANMYGWDERTLICNCTSKLRGYAKGWYERQASYDVSWAEWKSRLISAFPFTQNTLSQIRELVNKIRPENEDPVKFYYDKLGLGMSCGMTDSIIANAIIGTLGNKLMEVGAMSAGCKSTSELLTYLANIKMSTVPSSGEIKTDDKFTKSDQKKGRYSNNKAHVQGKCFSCGKRGHIRANCRFNKEKAATCGFCHKAGHDESNCFKKKKYPSPKDKTCSYCMNKGHDQEECRIKKRSTENQNKTVRRVEVVMGDTIDQKYYKTVIVNGSLANAFLDLGSSCNTMKDSYCKNLGLVPAKDDSVVLKGYGNASTLPLGNLSALLSVDGVERHMMFYVVPDDVQNFDVLIGQPFTESPNVVILKTSTQLNIYESEVPLELPDMDGDNQKICLFPQTDMILHPGLNKVVVNTEPLVTGTIKLELGEQWKPLAEKNIVAGEAEVLNGTAVIMINNLSSRNLPLKGQECVARVELSKVSHEEDSPRVGCNLTKSQELSLKRLLDKFEHCFSGRGLEIGNCNVEMSIKLTEDKVVNFRPYRMSYHEREVVRQTVAELLSSGIIEHSKSPYASPVLLVRKKDGGFRMCVDYRALNKITVKERYPLPVIQDLLDRLGDKAVFCSLDLANGYHQIRIAEESRPYTAFVTPDSLYQFKMVSFGLCNAPAVFQRAMTEILEPVLHKCAEVYIDDVIIWGTDIEDCLSNLQTVLELISASGVKLKRSKCCFLTDNIEYLGHEISKGELRPSRQKLQAVDEFKTPRNVHEVRQFLGLASYFRRFIKGFATTARPLTLLTKQNVEWNWGPQQEEAMRLLKEALTSDPVLAIYNLDKETQVHTDASKVGLGGILLQRHANGTWQVVAYASRQTTATEEKYHSFELEALAVVFSIMKFRVYLTGIKFTVVTDCSALRLAWSKRELSPRIARWWLDLQEYDFDVEHRPGTTMLHVDALSRNPINISHIEERDLVDTLQAGDEEIQALLLNLQLESDANKHKSKGLNAEYKIVSGRLCRLIDGQTLPVLPKSARWHILKVYHDESGHLGVDKCLEAIKAKYWFPKMTKFVNKYVRSCLGCQFGKKSTGKQPGLLHPIPRVSTPMDTVHVDHLGPFCKSNGKTYIVAIVDGFTKFVWLEAVASANARGAIAALERLSHVFGYPNRIISDQGTAFTGKDFADFCKRNLIKHIKNAVASPRANGQVERMNRTILSSLTAHLGEERKGWDAYLPNIQLGINSTVNNGTGKTPLELMCALRPRLSQDIEGPIRIAEDFLDLREGAKEQIVRNAIKMKTRYDKRRRAGEPIDVGALVMVERRILRPGLTSGKLAPKYGGPYKVTRILPNDRFEVQSATKGKGGYKNIMARDKLKLYRERIMTSSEEE